MEAAIGVCNPAARTAATEEVIEASEDARNPVGVRAEEDDA